MPRDVDIALVRAFLAVAVAGSITRAAHVLHLTQGAVSQRIKRLEEGLGVELLVREPRQSRLTPAGERLQRVAERLVAVNDELMDLLAEPVFTGKVKLGIPCDLVAPFGAAILRGFAQAHPRVELSLESSTTVRLLQRLAEGVIDLTLTTEKNPAEGADVLLSEPLVWAGARGGSAHLRHPLPMTIGDETCAFRASALAALREAGRDWQLMCLVSDNPAQVATLAADLAIAPMLRSTVPEGLQILHDDARLGSLPTFHINLRLPPSGASATVQELARHIREMFALRYARRPQSRQADGKRSNNGGKPRLQAGMQVPSLPARDDVPTGSRQNRSRKLG